MAKRVSTAQAKAQLSALVAQVANGGEHFVIERRGKPLAALVSVADLERLEQTATGAERTAGFLAMVGAWAGLMTNEEIDEMVTYIYAERKGTFASLPSRSRAT